MKIILTISRSWLLSELKKMVSGINDKVNPHLTLHEAIVTLYKMEQYPVKANDHYLERFKANIHTVELAKGGHIFCSPKLLSKTSGNTLTTYKNEVETFEKRLTWFSSV